MADPLADLVAAITASALAAQRNELVQLVGDAVDEIRRTAPAPLLDRAGLAKALSVSTPTVDRLRDLPGFPELKIFDAIRFELDAVKAFLHERSSVDKSLRVLPGGRAQ